MSRWLRAGVIVAALGLAPAPAFANPVDLFGFGGRAPAMAGAQTAAVEDGSANYYNPAALAFFDEIRIDLGYQGAVPRLLINGENLGVDSARGFSTAVSVPGKLGPVHLTVGTSLYIPDQHVTRLRSLGSDQPRFVLFDNRPQRLFLAANVALRIGSRVAIGGGLAYMSRTRGTVELNGLVAVPDPAASELDLSIDTDLESVRYPQVGVLVQATPWLKLGASFRAGFQLELEQRLRVTGDIGTPGADPLVMDGFLAIRAQTMDHFQPQQFSLGGELSVAELGLDVALDLSYHRWSQFDNPASRLEFDVDVGQFNDLLNLPEPRTDFPDPDFRDIVVTRVGAEWLAFSRENHQIELRGGYAFEPTPTPEQDGENNFADSHKHTLAIGAGWTVGGFTEILPRPVTIDLFWSTTVLQSRTHRKLSPVDLVGDYESKGQLFSAGVNTRWRF